MSDFGFETDEEVEKESKARVVIQDDQRGDAPYHVYEVDDDGHVVATLGNFESTSEAETEAAAYAAAAGLDVSNEVE